MWRRRELGVALSLIVVAAMGACGPGGADVDRTDVLDTLGSEDCSDLPFVHLRTFQPATGVIGQSDLVSTRAPGPVGDDTLGLPGGLGCGSLWVTQYQAHRVLNFPTPTPATGARATLVLGQPDFGSADDRPVSASSLKGPTAVVEHEGRLVVCDRAGCRVLIWNAVPTRNGTPANVVLGQPTFIAEEFCGSMATRRNFRPAGCAIADGRLFVLDSRGRVLIWNEIPSGNNAPADRILGQRSATAFSDDVDAVTLGSSCAGMWTDGIRLVVSDAGNDRVLVWNDISPGRPGWTANDDDLVPVGLPADLVLGQVDFSSAEQGVGPDRLALPAGVDSNGTQLAVVDSLNHRVLVWNEFPTVSGQLPDVVLGQGDFNHRASDDTDQDGLPGPDDASARTLNTGAGFAVGYPGVRFIGNRLYVSDRGNSRIVVFESGR